MWPDTEMRALYTSRLKIKTSNDIFKENLWKSKVQPVDEMRWFCEILETQYIHNSLLQVLILYPTYFILQFFLKLHSFTDLYKHLIHRENLLYTHILTIFKADTSTYRIQLRYDEDI